MEEELEEKNVIIAKLEEELETKDKEMSFKEKSIQFLHKKILDV